VFRKQKAQNSAMKHPINSEMTFADAAMAQAPTRDFVHHKFLEFGSITTNPDFLNQINRLLARPRKNHLALSPGEQEAFNYAIELSIRDGKYQAMVLIHNEMSHNMHGYMEESGILRFLPWHRAYLLQLEQLLQTYDPSVEIPYWDWANDHNLPDWVFRPDGVTRDPDKKFPLPKQISVDLEVLSQTVYHEFTMALERFHDQVHMWVGGNTMPFIMKSPNDPLFWLHHSNVDRIWSQWQESNPAEIPSLSGVNTVMDPWFITAAMVNDIYALGYEYV
jgi:tyrosinase